MAYIILEHVKHSAQKVDAAGGKRVERTDLRLLTKMMFSVERTSTMRILLLLEIRCTNFLPPLLSPLDVPEMKPTTCAGSDVKI